MNGTTKGRSALRGAGTLATLGLAVSMAAGGVGSVHEVDRVPETAAAGPERVDLEAVHRIKEEAFQRSEVMEVLFHLTDANGPRLTGSPGFRSAASWAAGRFKEMGLENARLETWGKFGRSWSFDRLQAAMVEPVYAPLHAMPKAWCAGTHGPLTGEVVSAPLNGDSEEDRVRFDLTKYAAQIEDYAAKQKGRLHGKFVMIDPSRSLALPTKPEAVRLTDTGLEEMLQAPDPHPIPKFTWPLEKMPADEAERRALSAALPLEISSDFFNRRVRLQDRLNAFLREEGVLGVLDSDRRGTGGVLFTERAGSPGVDVPPAPPTLVVEPEAYNRMARLLEHDVPVKVTVDLDVRSDDTSPDMYNVVAEIPGTRKPQEIVMLGAHLDSWHGGTGATDNAAGCAVVIEAARILKALHLHLDRTVRVALWSGEEQGLLGSRAYVKTHFGDPVTMRLTPEHAHLSGYFNLDNGTGKVRGVYLQGNDAMRPIFEAWLAPFKDLGADAITIRDTGGTDHKSFDAVGLPGFQFIQDPIDYESRTHHSNLDVYDRIQAGDIMQAAAVMASCVYHAANRPGLLPRKPLPSPLPPQKTAAATDGGGAQTKTAAGR